MKYIKKTYKAILLCVIAMTAWSCELDEGSKGVVSPESYYSTKNGVNRGLDGLYAYYHRNLSDNSLFKDKLTTFTGGDDLTANSTKDHLLEADKFSVSGGNAPINEIYTFHYRAIMACNVFIDQVDPANFDDVFYNDVIGQARFLRGIMYLELVNMFGEIPMMTEPTTEFNIGFTDAKTVVKEVVIPDLEFAKLNVINSIRDTPASVQAGISNNKASKTAARAYLAKAYMALAGWPMKEDTPENWGKVKSNTKEIIDEGAYTLLDDYAHNFGYVGKPTSTHQEWEGNEEFIWGRVCNASNIVYGTNGRFNGIFWTDWLDFLCEWNFYNEMPNNYRTSYSVTEGTNWSYLDFTKWKYSGTYTHPTIMKFLWGGLNWSTYRVARGLPRSAKEEDYPEFIGFENDYENSSDIPEMRFAEVVLMYAEACARTGEDAEATEKLNWVRRRAYANGLPCQKDTIGNAISEGLLTTGYWKNPTPAVDYPQSGESDLIQAIIKERSYEFLGELGGVRWFDITRLEMVKDVTDNRDSREPELIGDPADINNWRMPVPSSELSNITGKE